MPSETTEGKPALKYSAGRVHSYEDVLVAQYLEELRKTPNIKHTYKPPPSPYAQKLTQPDVFLSPSRLRQLVEIHKKSANHPKSASSRPKSASSRVSLSSTPRSSASATAGRWAFTPRSTGSDRDCNTIKKRPGSAPIGGARSPKQRPYSASSANRKSRPLSAKSSSSSVSRSSNRRRRYTPLYKQQPRILKVTAFKNGNREKSCTVTAPNLRQAARRIYLDDGTLVTAENDICKDAEVYVSMGEKFKNPFANAVQNAQLKSGVTWTMNGLVLPEDGRQKTTKPHLTKRFNSLIEKKTVRVMVFKNGKATNGIELIADPKNWLGFLDHCTYKLDMGSPAKMAFDWEGNEVLNIDELPILDNCLQNVTVSPSLGPVWISKGEGFSPSGAKQFILSLLQFAKNKVEEFKHYQEQMNYFKNGMKEKVTMVTVLSMSDEEIYEELDTVDKDMEEHNNVIKKLRKQLRKLAFDVKAEEVDGNNYTMQHIQMLDTSDRLIGVHGIRLKVYQNGSEDDEVPVFFNLKEASKGTGGDKNKIFERLMDQLSSSCRTCKGESGPRGTLVRRIFLQSGKEVSEINQLQTGNADDEVEIWISYGENFKIPYVLSLQANFDRVKSYTAIVNDNGVMQEKHIAFREQLLAEDVLVPGRDKTYAWSAVVGVPDECVISRVDCTSGSMEGEQILMALKLMEVDVNSHFLQCKDDPQLLLYPELSVASKKRRGNKELWPSESQAWVITKPGYIYCKAMPQFVLTTVNSGVDTALPNGVKVQGHGVTLCKKFPGSPHQIWKFTNEGQIIAESNPELFLTYLGGILDNEDTVPRNETESLAPGNRFFLAVADKLSWKDAKYQRWAVKQERFDNLGQWKYSKVQNPEWNKLAYSWPVDEEGNLIEDYDWPMEGYFIPSAPPLKSSTLRSSFTSMVPMRLTVLKNGERDMIKAISVIGPDLTNMMKDINKSPSNGKNHHSRKKSSDDEDCKDSVTNAQHLHCEDLTLQQLEFMLFLEHCTSMVGLPFAARRVFDEEGREHFTLQDLTRDQCVYVSCGDAWTDPKLTKAEQQRRFLLSNLAADIAQIRQYVALRNPEGYVLEVEGGLTVNARIVVNCTAMSEVEYLEEEARKAALEEERQQLEGAEQARHEREEFLKQLIDEKKSAHDRSHARSEERLQTLKWPWERLVDEPEEAAIDEYELEKQKSFTNKELYQKYKAKVKQSPLYPRLHLQKFTYTDGYIAMSAKPDLVLGIVESEGRAPEVVLVRKKPDDIYQRWIIDDTGLIKAKHNWRLVISVSMPTNVRKEDDTMVMSYVGSPVLLLQHKGVQFGRANQRLRFVPETGLIHAFETDILDKEITAANKANICTFSITGDMRLDQPGYRVEIDVPHQKNKVLKLLVCSACARAMRGRYKAERITKNVDFACAMGTAKERGIKQIGSFQCLNGKVDLSIHEAEHTLDEWEQQLQALRHETSVRAIAREISQARIPRTMKVIIYKNGNGRLNEGHLVYASSVNGLLQQATACLQFPSAVRRIYTETGDIILDIDDLVNWLVDRYIHDMKRVKLMAIRQAKRNQKKQHVEEDVVPADEQEQEKAEIDIDENGDDAWLKTADGDPEIRVVTEEMSPPVGQDGDGNLVLKKKRREEEILAGIEVNVPPVEVILQQPVEVWASTGDKFIAPDVVESRAARKVQQREERAPVAQELDKEKHVLRQMQGRRLEEQSPGSFHPTSNPQHPVLIEGGWQHPSYDELLKHDTVHTLQTHLSEMKVVQGQDSDSLKTVNASVSRRLYGQPKMKRVLVYPNGESIHRAVYIWGESFQQIIDNATMRLNLRKPVKCVYDVIGRTVRTFESVERDMILCVSTGKAFMKPRDVKDEVEIRANWSRARKQHGPNATNISVKPSDLPNVDVDPFGPPVLAVSNNNTPLRKPPRPKSAKQRTVSPPGSSAQDDTQFLSEL